MVFLTFKNPHEKETLIYLKKQGLKYIASNYHCRFGELDLIMLDSQELVIIEVRYRSKIDYGLAQETVTKTKINKIKLATNYFLTQFPKWTTYAIRFDVFAINGSEKDWIQAAFV